MTRRIALDWRIRMPHPFNLWPRRCPFRMFTRAGMAMTTIMIMATIILITITTTTIMAQARRGCRFPA